MSDFFVRLGENINGPDAKIPEAVVDMSDSLLSLKKAYDANEDDFNEAMDAVDQILDLDRDIMIEGVDSIMDALLYIRDDTSIFQPGQDMGPSGKEGLNSLIDNFNFVKSLYEDANNFSDSAFFSSNSSVAFTHPFISFQSTSTSLNNPWSSS